LNAASARALAASETDIIRSCIGER
jgi:hypothetical protein